jgi:hypothetical protein
MLPSYSDNPVFAFQNTRPQPTIEIVSHRIIAYQGDGSYPVTARLQTPDRIMLTASQPHSFEVATLGSLKLTLGRRFAAASSSQSDFAGLGDWFCSGQCLSFEYYCKTAVEDVQRDGRFVYLLKRSRR